MRPCPCVAEPLTEGAARTKAGEGYASSMSMRFCEGTTSTMRTRTF